MVTSCPPDPIVSRDALMLGRELPPRCRPGFGASSSPQQTDRKLSTVAYSGDGHLLTVAPTGCGKGRSAVIPAALTYPGSLIVIDPKGEVAQVTARRRRELGQKVAILDPFHMVSETSDRLDPLDLLVLPGSHVDCDAEMLAALLGVGHEFESDRYWNDTSQSILSGLIAYQASARPANERSLVDVRSWFYRDDMDYDLAVVMDTKGKELIPKAREALVAYLSIPTDKTRPCVRSSAEATLAVLGSQAVSAVLKDSTVSLQDLSDGVPMTIYLVIPPEKLSSHAPLLRLWLATLMVTISRRKQIPAFKTLALVDEAGQLGSLNILQTAITLLRGSGLTVWTFFQDLSQIEQAYPKSWKTIINNCEVLQTFGTSRPFLARQWAEVLDCPTNDLLTLPHNQQLVAFPGRGVLRMTKLDYLHDPEFAGLFDPNPRYALWDLAHQQQGMNR